MQSTRTNVIADEYEKTYTKEWKAKGDARRKLEKRSNRLAVLLGKSRRLDFKKRMGIFRLSDRPQ